MKRRICIFALLVLLVATVVTVLSLPLTHWWELQRLGHVPEYANRSTREGEDEWRLAESTTWWGKPLDPRLFWQGRVVWNDASAQDAARRRGRGYPPIPAHLTNLAAGYPMVSRASADIVPSPWSGGLDGGRVTPFHITEAESSYWNWFWRTQPKPPAALEREQFDVAERILGTRKPMSIQGRNIRARTARDIASIEKTAKSRAREIGVPEEALTEDALFWAYEMRKRRDYAEEQKKAALWRPRDDRLAERFIDRFLGQLVVDVKFVKDPLTEEQIKAGNAWKFSYLQRLRRGKTDDSYINAYLDAWKLDRTQVLQEELPTRVE